jgi:hypothetical protein
LLQVVQAGQ